jgi:proteasome accessory factor B
MHFPSADDRDIAGSSALPLAGSPSLRLPLARLLQLVTILQSQQFPNARTLAEACGVSRRTIYRDLSNLEAAGLRVFYSPDKQGYELARECWIQPTQLNDKEALALLVMSRLGTIPDPFGVLLPTRSALAKVIQSLSVDVRSRITLSSELIPEDAASSEVAPDRRTLYETILGALSQRKRLRLWYRPRENTSLASTKLGLYRLARIESRWILVGYSSSHREVRSFRVGEIERIESTDEPYSTPPRFRLDRFLSKSNRANGGPLEEVRLRFTARVAPLVRDMATQSQRHPSTSASGDLDVFLAVESLDDIVFWVLGFGDQVEVIEPYELRWTVKDWAVRIADRYSDDAAIARSTGSQGAHTVAENGSDHAPARNGNPMSMDG